MLSIYHYFDVTVIIVTMMHCKYANTSGSDCVRSAIFIYIPTNLITYL